MNDNFKKYKERFILTIVIIILMFFIGFTNGGRSSVTLIERVAGDLLTPVVSVASKTVNSVSNTFEKVVNIPKIISENNRLEEENLALKDENLMLSDIIARSDYLRNEYELLSNSELNLIKASIIGRSAEHNDKYLIDKGSFSGIKTNDTVIVGIQSSENVIVEGLVGKIEEVGDNFSKISLIIEENNSISFTNVRTQEGGVINKTDGETIEGYMFDTQSDIIADDRLYTSGLGEIYSPRIYIGRVSNVVNDEENLRKNITVVPAVDFQKLSNVMVIVGESYEEQN